jgi:hypothetical protein
VAGLWALGPEGLLLAQPGRAQALDERRRCWPGGASGAPAVAAGLWCGRGGGGEVEEAGPGAGGSTRLSEGGVCGMMQCGRLPASVFGAQLDGLLLACTRLIDRSWLNDMVFNARAAGCKAGGEPQALHRAPSSAAHGVSSTSFQIVLQSEHSAGARFLRSARLS